MWCERKTQQRNERFREFRILYECMCGQLQLFAKYEKKYCKRQCESLSFTNSIIISSLCVAIVSILFSPLVNVTLFRTLAHRCSRSDATNNRTNEWRWWRAIFSHIADLFASSPISTITHNIHFGLTLVFVVGGNDFKNRSSRLLSPFWLCCWCCSFYEKNLLSCIYLIFFSFILSIKHKIIQLTTLIVHWTRHGFTVN